MKFIVLLFATLIVTSCSELEEDEITRAIPIEIFSVKNKSTLNIEFTASNSCGSMCWKRTYFEKTISGNDIYIKTFATMDGSLVCTAVCVSVDVPINITLSSPGSYNFHFWKSDTSSIDTTIIMGI